MLGWCIMTLAGARLKASMWLPPLKGMFKEALARDAIESHTIVEENIWLNQGV